MPIPACEDFPIGLSGRCYLDSLYMKVAKQSTLECSDLGQAPKMSRATTTPKPVSSHLDIVFYWLRQAWMREGVWQSTALLHFNPSITQVKTLAIAHFQVLQ